MTNQKIPSLQKQLEAIKKRAGNPVTSNPAVSASKQLGNYETRIEATGKNPEDVTDKRNLIEKALRLPENQNAIFDVFELLGRPSKALFGGVNALVDNAQGGKRSVGQAMLEGLSGESKESVKTILKNLTNSNLGDKEGKWDWIDTLDIAGEIFLDPVDWALIPATGGAKLAMDAAQTAKAAGQAIDVAKVAGAAADIADAAKVADTAADAVKTTKQMKSVSDLLFQGAYKGAGASIKGADNLISKTLKSVSEDDWYRMYNGLKTDVNRAFTQGGKAFKGILRQTDSSVELMRKVIMPKMARVDDLITTTVQKYGGEVSHEIVSKGIYDMTEYMDIELGVPKQIKLTDLIPEMVRKGNRGLNISEANIMYSDEAYAVLKQAFESSGLGKIDGFVEIRKGTGGRDYIQFKSDFFNKKSTIGKKVAYKELLDSIDNADEIIVPIKRSLSDMEFARLTTLKNDPIMIEATKEYLKIQDEVYKAIETFTGIPVDVLKKWSKTNDWRIAHTANDILTDEARAQLAKVDKRLMDVFGGQASVVKARKFNAPALEVNNEVRDQFVMAAAAGELGKIPDDLEALAKVFYGTDMFTRDLKSAFGLFADSQAESIIRNDGLQRILLMAADNTLDDPQLVLGDYGQGVPSHMTKISNDVGAKLGVRLRTMASIYGDKTIAPKLMKLSKDLESGNMMISKGLLQLLNRNTSREFTNNIVEALSKFNNVYKAGKTLSPMFNVTNLGGNVFNMAMSGMSFRDIITYYGKSHKMVQQIPDIVDKLSRGVIKAGSEEEEIAKIIQEFINEGILGPSGELAPLGIAAKLQDMDTMSKYAGKENYNYVDQMVKVHAKDGSFKEKYGYEVREFYDRINQQISDATQPIEEVAGEALSIVSKQDAAIKEVVNQVNLPEGVPEQLEDYGVHYGDMTANVKSETIGESTGSRSTGHFGTGLYVLGSDTNAGSYASKTANKINMSDYKLYKAPSAEAGYKVHNGLHELNSLTSVLDGVTMKELDDLDYMLAYADEGAIDATSELISSFAKDSGRAVQTTYRQEEAITDFVNKLIEDSDEATETYLNMPVKLRDMVHMAKNEVNDVGYISEETLESLTTVAESYSKTIDKLAGARKYLIDTLDLEYNQYRDAINNVFNHLENYSKTGDNNLDSASTVFMKSLGYEGVDVRGIKELDNTTYGSVIYDIKKGPTKQPSISKEITENVRQSAKLSFNGQEFDSPKTLIKEVKKSIKQNQYWSFKGKRYDKTTDGINSLIKSIDNTDAKALITKRIKDIKASGKKITSAELDSIFSRVLVTDFKVVNEAVEGGFTPETLAYLEKAYAKSGDDMEVFAKATRGKNKVAFTKGDGVVETVADVTPTPEPTDLVSPSTVDYGKVYKGEEVSVRPYTDAELKEIKTQKTWTKEKRAEFKEIRDAEAAEAEANYEYLMKAKDPRVAGKTKKEWISANKDRTKSAEFLNENSLEKTIDCKNAALDKAIAKLDPELKDAFLSGDGPKINQAIAKTLGKDFNPINNLIKLNMKGNATVDSYSRLAMYLKAKEDPSFLANLGVDNPMDAVRYALFDPADLSYTEENVLKKLIPFYTFTKKNLVFQMENLAKHSSKYHRLYKGIRGSWENSGIGWEHLPDYQMNQMYIPIPSIDENGNYNYVRVNLPFADAVEFASNPLQRLLSSFTPAVRAPFELATNRQIFTGQPISEFDGQMNKQIPFLDNKAAYALSQTGLDVPLRSITDLAGGLGNMFESLKAGQAPNPLDFTRGLNFTRQGNVQSNINSEMYEDLQAVKDYVSKIKQSGDVLPTIEEIGQSNNPLLNRIKAQLSKY